MFFHIILSIVYTAWSAPTLSFIQMSKTLDHFCHSLYLLGLHSSRAQAHPIDLSPHHHPTQRNHSCQSTPISILNLYTSLQYCPFSSPYSIFNPIPPTESLRYGLMFARQSLAHPYPRLSCQPCTGNLPDAIASFTRSTWHVRIRRVVHRSHCDR
jgi:hypothetical protein